VLNLMGYEAGRYNVLASFYRQGRLKPAELTEHVCSGTKNCAECRHGRELLNSRGISLAHDWESPTSRRQAKRLRWNDSQLSDMLRNWRNKNSITGAPRYIMRPIQKNGKPQGIDAGLLKYARIVIDNAVVNDFKRMTRTHDLTGIILNNGLSPEYSDQENVAFEGEDEDSKTQILRDPESSRNVKLLEASDDLDRIMVEASLTEEELEAIRAVELLEMSVREYAKEAGKSVPRVRKVRANAIRKLAAEAEYDRFDEYDMTFPNLM
ncbi:MAG: hypothetical protein ACWGQW_16425, partial [bacterium]